MGIVLLISMRVRTWDTNFFDVLCIIIYFLVPLSLIIVPLILEYNERKESRQHLRQPPTDSINQ